MEVLMGIFVKACVAVAASVICLAGLILYSKKKDYEKSRGYMFVCLSHNFSICTGNCQRKATNDQAGVTYY